MAKVDATKVKNVFSGAIEPTEEFAIKMDNNDPLSSFRNEFNIPPHINDKSKDSIYLCGNSLGLLPKRTEKYLREELNKWAMTGVEGHFEGKRPWATIDEKSCELVLPLVGAKDKSEVAIMNGLSVNNNLLLLSFYQPTKDRYKILIEGQAFCSDHHTIRSHLKFHGISENDGLIQVFPKHSTHSKTDNNNKNNNNHNNNNNNNQEIEESTEYISTKDICDLIDKHNDTIAVIWLGAVQYYTGQYFDIATITAKAHKYNIMVGYDLAHAMGNIPLKLHDWNVDFACWCSYKYLNSGPGSIAGIFVHSRHHNNNNNDFFENKRLTGWWGQELKNRFAMGAIHKPILGAQAWQMSNPAVLPTVCVEASLEIFNEAGIENLRQKSIYLTGYLECLLNKYCKKYVHTITPKDYKQRGCQLSLVFNHDVNLVHEEITKRGIICDVRKPYVMRIAPTPLYNTFKDVWQFVHLLTDALHHHDKSISKSKL